MARNSRFTVPGSAAIQCPFWRSLLLQNRRHPGVCDALSTNTRSQPSSSTRGRPSLWRSRVTKDGQSLFSPIRAASLSTAFLNGTGRSLSIWRGFYTVP